AGLRRLAVALVALVGVIAPAAQALAAPAVSVTAGDLLLSASETATTLTWSSTENGSYSVRVGGTGCTSDSTVDSGTYLSPASIATTVQSASLVEGPNEVRVCVTNAVPETGVGAVTVVLDTLAPTTSIDSGPAAVVSETTASFAVSADEPGSTFECSLDAAAFSACPPGPTFAALADGAHTLAVRAVDPAGNADPSPAQRAWSIDTSTPQTAIDSGPPAIGASVTVSVAFSSSQQGASFECSLDGAPFASCSSPAGYAGLSDDTHVLLVRAVTAAGTADPSPAAWIFTVDTAAPDTSITGGPPAQGASRTATVTFTSSEAGVAYQCSIDGGPFTSCTSPAVFAGLADGEHTAAVRAVDGAANVDATPAVVTWTVDAPPETAIDSAPDALTQSTSGTFRFSSPDAGSTFQCRLDSGDYAACNPPLTFVDLATGAHTLAVRAVDRGGEIDPTPATYSWTIDTTLAKLDGVRPGVVRKVRVKPHDHAATLSWRAPRDADFDHVEITRRPGRAGHRASLVYAGARTTYRDRRLRNGRVYRYRIVAVDRSGNRSRARKLRTIPPVRVVLGRRAEPPPFAPLELRWRPVDGARFYNVQVFRGATKVLTRWPGKAALSLGRSWRFGGEKRRLQRGRYSWYV
ncbi:MAG: hypothetical protein ACE5EV_07290, partial [Gaiellales bacterium]